MIKYVGIALFCFACLDEKLWKINLTDDDDDDSIRMYEYIHLTLYNLSQMKCLSNLRARARTLYKYRYRNFYKWLKILLYTNKWEYICTHAYTLCMHICLNVQLIEMEESCNCARKRARLHHACPVVLVIRNIRAVCVSDVRFTIKWMTIIAVLYMFFLSYTAFLSHFLYALTIEQH